MNTAILVNGFDQSGRERIASAVVGIFARPGLIRTLQDAGFDLEVRHTAMNQGGEFLTWREDPPEALRRP
jgi:hypothetical protein